MLYRYLANYQANFYYIDLYICPPIHSISNNHKEFVMYKALYIQFCSSVDAVIAMQTLHYH